MTYRARSGRFSSFLTIVGILAVVSAFLGHSTSLLAGTYQPCKLPVVVGATVRPNVMIIQDMTGSMQAAAYYDAIYNFIYYSSTVATSKYGCSALTGLGAYQNSVGYYGTADTDTYYTYNATGNSNGGYFQPVTSGAPSQLVQFTSDSEDGGSGTIKFTATGHGLVVGDWAAFYNLSSHTGMNGDAYQVVSVDGDSFKVTAEWNGTGDTIQGQVIKRVITSTNFTTGGVNGTVLNFLLTCRTDATMKAFIGGRATDFDGTYYYLKYQGMRRFVFDETLGVFAHIRPGTVDNPDAWASGTYYGVTGSSTDPEKDLYLTLSDFYKGTLLSTNPKALKNKTASPAQVWSFHLDTQSKVTIRAFAPPNVDADAPSWTPGINLYSGTTPTSSGYTALGSIYDYGGAVGTSSDACAVKTITLNAGDYCVEVYNAGTNNDSNGLPKSVTPTYYLAVTLEEGTGSVTRGSDPLVPLTIGTDPSYNGVHFTSTVGRLLNAQCRIQQHTDKRQGIIQSSFNLVRFGFMYYNSTSGNQGKILVGCDNTSMSKLINAFSGIGTDTINSTSLDFTKCYPYNGTYTGEAMGAAYNYFAQLSTYTGVASNTAFYPRRTTITDPYYGPDLDTSSKPLPVPCRKSYLLLVSDGEYNGSIDPCKPARAMHIGDLRTDLPNPTIVTKAGTKETPQNVTVYTIFAFSQAEAGKKSMKATAMFGAFQDVSGCGTATYPFPTLTVPSTYPGSLEFDWPITLCDPADPPTSGHSYNSICCLGWDQIWERPGEVTNSQKGIPDTYFEASDGRQLEDSLKKVIQQVLARDASASAVATVSQQLATGDTIIRGVFEASNPQKVENFLWYGHLEAFWPFTYGTSGDIVYDFDLTCNLGLRCEEMPGPGCTTRHCWDGGNTLMSRSVTTDPRTVFTYVNGVQTAFNATNITLSMLGSGVTSETQRQNLISWTLGNAVSGLRVRETTSGGLTYTHRLGDIVYSTPVVEGPPSPGAVSSNDPNLGDFYNYRNSTLNPNGCLSRTCTVSGTTETLYRDKVVYVGANDGMVHAFLLAKWDPALNAWRDQPTGAPGSEVNRQHPDIGREIWAYIPGNMLTELNSLAQTTYGLTTTGGCSHRAMVDLSDKVYEVYIQSTSCPSGSTRCWRSVLLGGERGGGDTYFAIDVTDPWNPKVLWEYSVIKDRIVIYSGKAYQPFSVAYSGMNSFPMSWTQPAVGRLKVPTTAKFYTGAPDSSGNPTTYVQYSATNNQNYRHVAFVGGGLRTFDSVFTTSPDPPAAYNSTTWNAFKLDLFNPSFLVIDIETGLNLFKYVWPTVVSNYSTVFPKVTSSTNTIPYAMADPVAVDVWNENTTQTGDDGFTDRVYAGDMNGNFYGIKFASLGIEVGLWPTKTISDTTERSSNVYRSTRQPITSSPAISFERPQQGTNPNLLIIFASGKYEDIVGASDDKWDLHHTTLYNLRDTATPPTISSSSKEVFKSGYLTGYKVQLVQNCTTNTYNPSSGNNATNPCKWIKDGGEPDCCESNCTSPCYACQYDLTLPGASGGPAERFIAKPLIAGGLVFATSFVPSINPCDYTGLGYLYVFDYQCAPFAEGYNPITDPSLASYVTTLTYTGGSGSGNYGVQLALGTGMPSRAVLDSAGQNVIIQMSDGTLKRVPVSLASKNIQIQGWMEK